MAEFVKRTCLCQMCTGIEKYEQFAS